MLRIETRYPGSKLIAVCFSVRISLCIARGIPAFSKEVPEMY